MVSRLVSVALLSIAACALPGSSSAECGINGIDLSPLKSNTDYVTSDGTWNYYWNPCGKVNFAACASLSPAATICQSLITEGNIVNALAYTQMGIFSLLNGTAPNPTKGVLARYIGEGQCYNQNAGGGAGGYENRMTSIKFICSSVQSNTFSLITGPEDLCTYSITFQTPFACGNSMIPYPAECANEPHPSTDGGREDGAGYGNGPQRFWVDIVGNGKACDYCRWVGADPPNRSYTCAVRGVADQYQYGVFSPSPDGRSVLRAYNHA